MRHRAGIELEEPRPSASEEHRGQPEVPGQLVHDLAGRAGSRAESLGHRAQCRPHRATDDVADRASLDQLAGPVKDGAPLGLQAREGVLGPRLVAKLPRVPARRQGRRGQSDDDLCDDDHPQGDAEACGQ